MSFGIGYKTTFALKVLNDFEEKIKARYLEQYAEDSETDKQRTLNDLIYIIAGVRDILIRNIDAYNNQQKATDFLGTKNNGCICLGRENFEAAQIRALWPKSFTKLFDLDKDTLKFFRDGSAEYRIGDDEPIKYPSELDRFLAELSRITFTNAELPVIIPFHMIIQFIPEIQDYYTFVRLLCKFPDDAQILLDLIEPFNDVKIRELSDDEKQNLVELTLTQCFSDKNPLQQYHIGLALAKVLNSKYTLEQRFFGLYSNQEQAISYVQHVTGFESLLSFLRRFPNCSQLILDSKTLKKLDLKRYLPTRPDSKINILGVIHQRHNEFFIFEDEKVKIILKIILEFPMEQQYKIGLVLATALSVVEPYKSEVDRRIFIERMQKTYLDYAEELKKRASTITDSVEKENVEAEQEAARVAALIVPNMVDQPRSIKCHIEDLLVKTHFAQPDIMPEVRRILEKLDQGRLGEIHQAFLTELYERTNASQEPHSPTRCQSTLLSPSRREARPGEVPGPDRRRGHKCTIS